MSSNIGHTYQFTSGVELFNVDCISFMERISENSVDLIFSVACFEHIHNLVGITTCVFNFISEAE